MTGDWVIGADLGGTKIEIALIGPQNTIAARVRIPTHPALGPQSVVDRIADEVARLSVHLPPGERIAALGLCSPGPVDYEAGTLLDPPNLAGLHYAPLQRMLAARLGIPVRIDHDAKAACLGEFHYGAGRGQRSVTYIIAGTGVGSATVLNGQLLRGLNNTAGEIGHAPIERDGELCSCGSRGCFETLFAGPWLVRHYQQKLHAANSTDDAEFTAVDIVQLALAGDPLARAVMEEAGHALGAAVATLAMILDVDLFVVGGSVVKSGDLLLEPARRALPAHCYRSVGCGVRIVATELGDDGHILGCAWMAREALAEARAAAPVITGTAASSFSAPQRLEDVEGMVFNVQRFSVHDGPGIRTNVFFKGCPLRCAWCCNPESQRFQPELGLSAQRCIHCGQFEDSCPENWSHGAVTQAEKDKFGARVEQCPGGALRWLGVRRTAGDVLAEALRDQPFYDGEGGITLTGGEPTAQPNFAEALLCLARQAGLSTAMETCGHTRWKVFERLLPYLDLVLFDLKHMDPEAHRRATGVDNEVILSNLRHLADAGAPVQVRVPLIPGVNADAESLTALASFVAALPGPARRVSLLPYHTLGWNKYVSLGRPSPANDHGPITPEQLAEFAQILGAHQLEVTVGS